MVLLGRVITRLGTSTTSTPASIENMFASDLAFLQDLYRRVNQEGHTRAARGLPGLPPRVRGRPGRWSPGGIVTYAADRLYEEVAYVAYHFHWRSTTILDLEHPVAPALRAGDQLDQPPHRRGLSGVAVPAAADSDGRRRRTGGTVPTAPRP